MRLSQILAQEKLAKAQAASIRDETYKTVQRAPLFNSTRRDYVPATEDGEQLPPETGTRIQQTVPAAIATMAESQTAFLDLVATKESANQMATGDVVVDGITVLGDVPVSVLLTLEKQLLDYATFVRALPGLDPQFPWTWDANESVYRAPDISTKRTKKVPRNHVKAEATDKHPAQVEVYYEDVVVGTWVQRITSAGISEKDRREMLKKITKLSAAVKVAREQANLTEAPEVSIGEQVFSFLGW